MTSKRRSTSTAAATVIVLSAIAGVASCSADAAVDAQDEVPASTGSDLDAARAYCEDSGGAALTAHPAYGTNSDRDQWLPLAGSAELCRFEDGEPGADSTTSIYVDLNTLSSELPTLAGLAYLAKLPPQVPETPSANPATFNCSALGGTSQFGDGASGGGWYTDDRPDEAIGLCVFADASFIDEFGILYYSDGTVRGADLSTVMRYEPQETHRVFDR